MADQEELLILCRLNPVVSSNLTFSAIRVKCLWLHMAFGALGRRFESFHFDFLVL